MIFIQWVTQNDRQRKMLLTYLKSTEFHLTMSKLYGIFQENR